MQIYLIVLIVGLLSFMLQIWPRLIKRYFGVDTWRWLLFADYVRKNKSLPKESPDQFIVKSVFGYPPVVIYFLSIFPQKFLEKYQFVFSPFFDFLNNYLIFIAAYMLTNSLPTAIVAQVIAALTPIIVIEASNLNSRILSYLIFTLSFFTLLMYSLTGGGVYLVTAGVALLTLFFTHRFAIQAYVISIVGLTIVEWSLFYVFFLLTVFALVNIVNGRLYRAILKEHISALRYWSDKLDYRFAHQVRGLSTSEKTEDFIQQVYALSIKNPLAYIIGNNPWVLLFFPLLLNVHYGFISMTSTLPLEVLYKLEIWTVALLAWAILVVSVKPLRI